MYWDKASAGQIPNYKNELHDMPQELTIQDFFHVRGVDLCNLHDEIIDCMIKASKKCLPMYNLGKKKEGSSRLVCV